MDSSTSVWPATLPVPLVNPARGSEARPLLTEMESSRIRSRRMFQEMQETMDVQWNFTADQFDTFKAFFDSDLENGTLSFMMEVFGEEVEVVFHDSNYSFSHSDALYEVVAVIELKSLPAVTLTIDIFEVGDIQEPGDPTNDYEPPIFEPPTSVTLGVSIEEVA